MTSILLSLLSLSWATAAPSPVIWAEIQGSIDPASSQYLEASIERAQRTGAQAVIVSLDTPGGLISSVREMAQSIDKSSVPVIVYVTPGGASATSAGALLALASHLAAMAPGTNIGAAHPVGTSGEDIGGSMGEKVVNDTVAFAKSLADLRGRSATVAEAIVAKSKSYTAEEAIKAKLVELIATDSRDLLAQLDGARVDIRGATHELKTQGAALVPIEMTTGQKLLHTLANPNIAAILTTLGMLLIYVEVSTPGIGIAGILGAICMLVAFMAFQALPIRWGAVALLFAGMGLFVAEIFATTHGALAAGGLISFVLGLIWLVDPASTSLVVSPMVWGGAAIGLGAAVAGLGYVLSRSQKLSEQAREAMGGGSVAGISGYTGRVETIENGGHAGTALFRGEIWKFTSYDALKIGDAVRAERVDGMIVRVRSQAVVGAKGAGLVVLAALALTGAELVRASELDEVPLEVRQGKSISTFDRLAPSQTQKGDLFVGESQAIIPAEPKAVFEALSDPKVFAKIFEKMRLNRPITDEGVQSILAIADESVQAERARELPEAPVARKSVGTDLTSGLFFRILKTHALLSDRWYIARETRDSRRASTGRYSIRYERVAGNFKHYEAEWSILSYPSGPSDKSPTQTYIKLRTIFDLGLPIPGFLLKLGRGEMSGPLDKLREHFKSQQPDKLPG